MEALLLFLQGLTDVQNAAADNSVDFLASIEEAIATDVTTSTTIDYGTATGSVSDVRVGSATGSTAFPAMVTGAPTDGYKKQFDIDFPAGSAGSENEVEGELTVTTYDDGSWSVDGEDVKFKVQDLDGNDEMVGVKYKGTKMNPEGEIEGGDISVLDALNAEKPIGKDTLSTLKKIGGFFKKVDKKLMDFAAANPTTPPLVPEPATATQSTTTTFYVDGTEVTTDAPSPDDYPDMEAYNAADAAYLGGLKASMTDNVTREAITEFPKMVSSTALQNVDASMTMSITDSIKITAPDTANTKYDQTTTFKLTGTIKLTENGTPQTLEFVEMNQISEFSQTIANDDPPALDTRGSFKIRYTGSIRFNGVELKLTNGVMKNLLKLQNTVSSQIGMDETEM